MVIEFPGIGRDGQVHGLCRLHGLSDNGQKDLPRIPALHHFSQPQTADRAETGDAGIDDELGIELGINVIGHPRVGDVREHLGELLKARALFPGLPDNEVTGSGHGDFTLCCHGAANAD